MNKKLLFLIILMTFINSVFVFSESSKVIFSAHSITDKDYQKNVPYDRFSDIKGVGRQFRSSFSYLKVIVRQKNDCSEIVIKYNGLTRTIETNYEVTDVIWRPNHKSFIYTMFVPGLDDFGETKINYVSVNIANKSLVLKDREISDQLCTDLAWSDDGRFLCYSNGSQLWIREFDANRYWGSQKIIIDNRLTIQPDTLVAIGGFNWINHNQSIAFYWKDNPLADQVAGYGIILVPDIINKRVKN